MAKINIEFDGKIYSVDESILAPLASPLEQALIKQLAGTGAIIRFGNTNYNVDANKLASARNVLTDHFGNVAGTDSKVTVNDVEYGLSKTKLQGATTKVHDTLEGMAVKASEGLAYELNEDGVSYSVIGIGTCIDNELIIPATYQRMPVTALKSHTEWREDPEMGPGPYEVTVGTFEGNTNITSVSIPDSVTTMDMYSFGACSNLESVVIGNGVTNIGEYAFSMCSSLINVTIGNSVTDIGEGAFSNCESLTSITLPDNIKSIGPYAFKECALSSIVIPDSVEHIGGYPFSSYSAPFKIYVTNLAKWCSIDFSGTVFYDQTELYADNNLVTAVEFPEGTDITEIKPFAFSRYSKLERVTIPASVISIGTNAFSHCKFTSIIIPEGIKRLDSEAFAYNYNVTEIKFNATAMEDSPEGRIFYWTGYKDGCVLTIGANVERIPANFFADSGSGYSSSITSCVFEGGSICSSIGQNAFAYCLDLINVELPDSVVSIEHAAFDTCRSLTNITLSNNLTDIGSFAFRSCPGLSSITLPDSVTNIGRYAFSNCTNLSTLVMSKNIATIGEYAFDKCEKLTDIYITDLEKWCGINFGSRREDNPLFYAENLYLNGELVNNELKIPEGISEIAKYAFVNYSHITSVIIPDSVTSIDAGAFCGCTGLTSVMIPDSVTNIGGATFGECTNLSNIVIPAGITSIKGSTFYNCSSLSNIIIPDSVTSIGDYAFQNCKILTNVIIPDNVTSIGDWAFASCDSFTNITIPDSVTSIGSYAFAYCESLTGITIGNGVTSVGKQAFSGCSSLKYNEYNNGKYLGNSENPYIVLIGLIDKSATSFTIPDNTKIIHDYALSSYKSLTSVIIPDSVTSIGYGAFRDTSNLTSITIPNSVTSMGDYAFYGCRSLTSITIGNSVASIGDYAFQSCSRLTSVYITDITKWCDISFSSYYGNPLYYAKNLYLNGNLVTDLEIPDGVIEIKPYAFHNCSLTSVTIPDSVTSIGSSAFRECDALASIAFGDGVTSIGEDAFYECYALASVAFGNSVTSIGSHAFQSCSRLTSITIPNNVTSIGGGAFSGCSSLTSVMIGNGVESIGWGAFSDCYDLRAIYINKPTDSVEGAPWGSDYATVYWNSTGPELADNGLILVKDAESQSYSIASLSTKDINEFIIPDSYNGYPITKIDHKAFSDCYSLTNITIPDSITSIGNYAFENCSSLMSIIIPKSITTMGYCVFDNSPTLIFVESAEVPEGWAYEWNSNCKFICDYDGIEREYIFDSNGGTHVDNITAAYIEELPTTSKDNCYFIGWYTDPEFSSEPVSNYYYSKTHNTLYAKWITEEEWLSFKDGSSFDKAIHATAGGEYTVTINEPGQYYYFEFIPDETAYYLIQATGNNDTYGYLYDSGHNEISSNDDYDDYNFGIEQQLTAGQTYYVATRFYSSDTTGDFIVRFKRS